MKKYVLLSMVAAALVGCGGGEEPLELEGQAEVAPVIQEDETGRVTASALNCEVGVSSCTPANCVRSGQCTMAQYVAGCVSAISRLCPH
ncbi:hypothetical protein JY651_22310 [Pyxidicoccus parkwayensis]|uniref:Lipoprotein n=1 Tax=Pyxidicoccus parkwayensis TaxID=2813578 RepID=A0ABX7PAI0_9BACT|nr:hypothetical protein [Pyxidicoccus parkwaysis]QSQ27476.1 hypothetical protein JY651_22310 [Pyxidicoccus parkwaysis]